MPDVLEEDRRIAIKVPEAAARMSMDKSTLYKLIKNGEFPARRLGKTWYVSVRAVEKFFELREDEVEAFLKAEDAR